MDQSSSWSPQPSDVTHKQEVMSSTMKPRGQLTPKDLEETLNLVDPDVGSAEVKPSTEGSQSCEVCKKQCVMCALHTAQQSVQVALDEIYRSQGESNFCSCAVHRHLNSDRYSHSDVKKVT